MSSQGQESQSRYSLRSAVQSHLRSTSLRVLLTALKILVGVALLIWSVRDIQLGSLVAGIKSAHLTWLFLATLLILFGLVLKLWRWLILVKNYGIHASFTRIFSAYFVGQATNIILPMRAGELARLGYFAGEKTLLPRAASTIILEKYLDLVALTTCGILVSLKISLDNVLNWRGWLLPLTIVVTVLLLVAILLGPSVWVKICERKMLPQSIMVWLDQWVRASQWLRDPILVIPGVFLTILIWGVMWLTNLCLFTSLGMPADATAGGLVLVLVYIGLFPALMPGNIGPFYFFARLALIPFGIIPDQAIIFAVLLHAMVTLPPLLGGVIGLLLRSKPPINS
jgi:uncharacterized membrane protein YbhN (UPF0104 family)